RFCCRPCYGWRGGGSSWRREGRMRVGPPAWRHHAQLCSRRTWEPRGFTSTSRAWQLDAEHSNFPLARHAPLVHSVHRNRRFGVYSTKSRTQRMYGIYLEGDMFKSFAARAVAGLCLVPGAFSQTTPKVDFARDVQPIFRQNCIGCHGPAKEDYGLRVARRSSVLKPGVRRVVPGSSENSFLYHRLAGSDFGMQMPPTGALRPKQLQIVKAWIEQGAEWPDSLANEIELPPLNPKAVSM